MPFFIYVFSLSLASQTAFFRQENFSMFIYYFFGGIDVEVSTIYIGLRVFRYRKEKRQAKYQSEKSHEIYPVTLEKPR